MFFAAYVTLLKDDEQEVRYRLVGPDEIDHAPGNISIDSPLARALLKKQVDDEVTIRVQDGDHCYLILAIDY